MRLKKLISLLLCSLVILTLNSFAGDIVNYGTSQPTQQPTTTSKRFNVHLNMGFSWNNWSDSYSDYDFTSNGSSSFAMGLSLTHPLNQYFSLQSGFIYTPDVDYTDNGGHTISQWLSNFMVQIHYPWSNKTDLFAGAGLGVRFTDFDGDQSQTMRPAFSLGAHHTLNTYWDVEMRYLRVDSVGDDSYGNFIPTSNIITIGIGYTF
jgi:hypothetical protein